MMANLPLGYALREVVPDIADYLRLRKIAGLTPRSVASAVAGLPRSVHGVVVRHEGQTVGMGRVVGDGALFLQIVDVAVDPRHQGQGLGKAVMAALLGHITAQASAEVHVSLIADGEAHRLYAKFGFEPVAPHSRGMAIWITPL